MLIVKYKDPWDKWLVIVCSYIMKLVQLNSLYVSFDLEFHILFWINYKIESSEPLEWQTRMNYVETHD